MLAKTINDIAKFNDGENVVYISGKVTGLEYVEAWLKFANAQSLLEIKGYTVINPMHLVAEEASWQDAMRICISYLPHANFIYLLPDWEDSEGAKIEKYLADKLGIKHLEL